MKRENSLPPFRASGFGSRQPGQHPASFRASMTLATITTLLLTNWSEPGSAQPTGSRSAQGQATVPPAQAAQPLGQGMGIQVQAWYLQPDDLAEIAKAGFGVVRWGIDWQRVEKVAGVYDWSEVDRFVDKLSVSGMRSVVVLAYGNRLYIDSEQTFSTKASNQFIEARPPVTVAARNAFARFAAAAAGRYRDRPITWEIWNEPDNPAFWLPRPNPASYAILAQQTCLAMRAVSPRAEVLAGVGAALPNAVSQHENIYNALMSNGALDCLDGVSSHAYRMSSNYREPDPESIETDDRASRAYLYSQLRMEPQKRFVITEWGFTSYNVSANLQAAYLIRGNLMNAATGVPLTIWYEWRDSRANSSDPESHFGLLTTYGGEKNSSDAHMVLSKIAHARLVRRLSVNRDDARVFQLRDAGGTFIVAWKRTSSETARSRLYVDGRYRGDIIFMPSIIAVAGPHTPCIRVE